MYEREGPRWGDALAQMDKERPLFPLSPLSPPQLPYSLLLSFARSILAPPSPTLAPHQVRHEAAPVIATTLQGRDSSSVSQFAPAPHQVRHEATPGRLVQRAAPPRRHREVRRAGRRLPPRPRATPREAETVFEKRCR